VIYILVFVFVLELDVELGAFVEFFKIKLQIIKYFFYTIYIVIDVCLKLPNVIKLINVKKKI